jgi:hypothetical protein
MAYNISCNYMNFHYCLWPNLDLFSECDLATLASDASTAATSDVCIPRNLRLDE